MPVEVTPIGFGSDPSRYSGGLVPTGRFASRGPGNVDPRLREILGAAAANFPGYRVEAFSGYRPGDKRFHGKGRATDVRLIDVKTGKAVPNYQDAKGFRVYEKFAQKAKAAQKALYPELDKSFRWGGYFGGPVKNSLLGTKGKYGAVDLMHFDIGGAGMKGGSFKSGLTAAQRGLIPGAESIGIGNTSFLPGSAPVPPSQFTAPTESVRRQSLPPATPSSFLARPEMPGSLAPTIERRSAVPPEVWGAKQSFAPSPQRPPDMMWQGQTAAPQMPPAAPPAAVPSMPTAQQPPAGWSVQRAPPPTVAPPQSFPPAPMNFPPAPAPPSPLGTLFGKPKGGMLAKATPMAAAAVGSALGGLPGGLIGMLAGRALANGLQNGMPGMGGAFEAPQLDRFGVGSGLSGIMAAMGGRPGATGFSRSNPGMSVTSLGNGMTERRSNKYGWTERVAPDGSVVGISYDRPSKSPKADKAIERGWSGLF